MYLKPVGYLIKEFDIVESGVVEVKGVQDTKGVALCLVTLSVKSLR